jgi:hypothetical protein
MIIELINKVHNQTIKQNDNVLKLLLIINKLNIIE